MKYLKFPLLFLFSLLLISCSYDNKNDNQNDVIKNYYRVIFNSNGGSSINSQLIQYGKTATKPASPTKQGTETLTYTFVDWYSDSLLNCIFDFATPITSNITLYAKWNEIEKEYSFHETVTYLPEDYYGTHGTANDSGVYVFFGDWPQTIKSDDITVYETQSLIRGGFTYYKGSDRYWYVKCVEDAYDKNYTYSNGKIIGSVNENSIKYFRVEPIKWRILNPDETGLEKKILLAENILTSNIPYYGTLSSRTLNSKTIYENNYKYSNIRAYLNGINNQYVIDGGIATNSDINWSNIGFLQSAFTASAQELIDYTEINNSAESTNPANNPGFWNNGNNQYECENTIDKIFLLSEKESTLSIFNNITPDHLARRIPILRVATDYAKANHAYQYSTYGGVGCWWLRSPQYDYSYSVRIVNTEGSAYDLSKANWTYLGIVPALCLK